MRNYSEFKSFGRGADSADPYYIAFEPQLITVPVSSGISPLSDKSGLIIKRIGKSPLSGFIKLDEFYQVYRRYKYALDKICEAEMNPLTEEAEYVFRMGQFKGKTPSQLLLSGTKKEDLLSQKDFLAKNAQGKFEKDNKKGIADIEKAIKLFEEGNLKPSSNTALAVFDSGPRYFPTNEPQPYETTGWNLKIICNTTSDKNQFVVSWEKKTVTIQENVIKAVKKDSIKSESAGLTITEFSSAMEEAMLIFNHAQESRLSDHLNYAVAHKDDWKNNSGSKKPASSPKKESAPQQNTAPKQTENPVEKPETKTVVNDDFKDVDECPFD